MCNSERGEKPLIPRSIMGRLGIPRRDAPRNVLKRNSSLLHSISEMKTVFLSLVLLGSAISAAQTAPEAELLQQIIAIRAIDNHSHPPKVVAAGEKDDDYDALPCDPLAQAPMPVKVRADNPEFIEAWK